MTVAVQPDDLPVPFGRGSDASSPLWIEALRAAGQEVRLVNVFAPGVVDQLRDCDGFLWRFHMLPAARQIARRLLPIAEQVLGLLVYPDQATCWHYDDKWAQQLLFEALGIPTPRTWLWAEQTAAEAWARQAEYPLVLKLSGGAASQNVALVRSADEAIGHVRRLFRWGYFALPGDTFRQRLARFRDCLAAARAAWHGAAATPPLSWEVHRDYVLFQEYLPDNAFDTRVTVIGNRAFAFRRFNRPDDFRASGSGRIDWDPAQIDPGFVRLAFRVARALGSASCAIDGLYRRGQHVLCEVSYAYLSYAVHKCPGHWRLAGDDPDAAELLWQDGALRPETAQIEDFLARLANRTRRSAPPAAR